MRIRQLDGLRALAVALVFVHHHQLFEWGWIGVEFFFVLSGFLITGILRRSRSNAHFWRDFYVKRLTRIVPPVIVAILLAIVVIHKAPRALLGYLLPLANIMVLLPSAVPPVGVMWSLAIEEHFYFVWPSLIRKLNRRALFRVIAAILIASPILRVAATLILPHFFGPLIGWKTPVYLLTVFRLDSMASGAALALVLEQPGIWAERLTRYAGSVALASAALMITLSATNPAFDRSANSILFAAVGYSLVTAVSFFLVAYLVVVPGGILSRILASPIPVWIGSISYGVYLYHTIARALVSHILKSFGQPRPSVSIELLLDAALALVMASLSYYLIEQPIMKFGKRQTAVKHQPATVAAFETAAS